MISMILVTNIYCCYDILPHNMNHDCVGKIKGRNWGWGVPGVPR